MEIKGKLLECMDVVKVSEHFRKREFILEYTTNPEFTEVLKFELVQDRCELLDGFKAGQEIRVDFDLKGRRWTDSQGHIKYFNSLRAWRLTKEGVESNTSAQDLSSSSALEELLPENLGPPNSDELPF